MKEKSNLKNRQTRTSPYSFRGRERTPPDVSVLLQIGDICSRAIKKHREIKWTDYVRTNVRCLVKYRSFNVGLPIEPCMECSICTRLLPLCLMTGDHAIPKSNHIEMRKVIAFQYDKISPVDYDFLLNYNLVLDKNKYKENLEAIAAFKHIKYYDDTLKYDLRNIQAACFSCNTKKGSRVVDNVNLFSEMFPEVKRFSREM